MNLSEKYITTRLRTEEICKPLQTEDYVIQPVADVSPPKWHIGHTTWFFETFILKKLLEGYKEFNSDFNYVFNSYYETVGARVIRTDRGNLSRPTVLEVQQYRKYVDEAMLKVLTGTDTEEIKQLITLGLNHEEQHQELLCTDIKYILGNNPLFPVYSPDTFEKDPDVPESTFIEVGEGLYEVGYNGNSFCFDNELSRHKIFLHRFTISSALVTNAEYLEFIEAGGYTDFRFWHAEGWDWVRTNHVLSPMYWHLIDGKWHNYSLQGLTPLTLRTPVTHISFYEAAAYASWKGCRLPTEFEWEIAAPAFHWGSRWEWTESAYLPYPGFQKAEGAIGEYNGKFMVNQKVLRGASVATPPGHSRISYRNFFHPHLRWQFTGIRLAR